MSDLYQDKASQATKPHKHVGLWDDRPRFLGMFSSYDISKQPQSKKVPPIGIGDHLITCPCGAHEQHPRFLTVVIYVRLGGRLYTVSWPTWASF